MNVQNYLIRFWRCTAWSLLLLLCFSNTSWGQSSPGQVQDLLQQEASKQGLTEQDVQDVIVTHDHVSSTSQMHHLYLRQRYEGIEVYGANMSIHLRPDQSVFKVNNDFISQLSDKIVSNSATLSAKEAITKAAQQLGYSSPEGVEAMERTSGKDQQQKFTGGSISEKDIKVKLMYQPDSNGSLRLAWDMIIKKVEEKRPHSWSIRIDAATGMILSKHDLIDHCNSKDHNKKGHTCSNAHSNCDFEGPAVHSERNAMVGGYRVFPLPLTNPLDGNRELINDPDDPVASPFGWHDTNGSSGSEFTITRGNNAHAFTEGTNFSPDGGAGLNFDFPLDLNDISVSESANLTNLFYIINLGHDILYHYGFDEASGNLQQSNYGNGGIGGDYTIARAQFDEGCGAAMDTPVDGENATMEVYINGNNDGSLSNNIILHEYVHSLTRRLIGGAGNSDCLSNHEHPSEGWSDWYALVLTIQPGDIGTTPREIGDWFCNGGIREYPYTTAILTNPLTYADLPDAGGSHGRGEIWASMLWEMTWALINEVGFDPDVYNGTGGNNIALHLVTEALKLTECDPGFVDARDAILEADQILYNGEYYCLIWKAFAKRGLGTNADQGNSFYPNDGEAGFEYPECCEPANVPVPFYVIEDLAGNATDEFCQGEFIIMDASGSQNETSFYIDVWRRPIGSSGPFLWVHEIGDYEGQAGVFNLTIEGLLDGFVFSQGYEYQIKLAVRGECDPWTEYLDEFIVAEDFGEPAFVLENANGEAQNEFCEGEVVWLNASASENETSSFVRIKRRPIGSTDNYQSYNNIGWISGEAGLINLSENGLFLDGGYEYEVTFAIAGLCFSWTDVKDVFTVYLNEGFPVAHFEDSAGDVVKEFCPGDQIILNGSDTQNETKYFLDAWRRPIGSTGNFMWVHSFGWTPGEIETVDLTDEAAMDGFVFVGGYEYQIKLAIEGVCFDWTEHLENFTVHPDQGVAAYHFEDVDGVEKTEFCIGEEVYLDGTDSENEAAYFIDIWERPIGSTEDFDYLTGFGWTPGEAEIENLTHNAADNGVTFEPGIEYQVKFAIDGQCLEWTEVLHEFTIVVCCEDVGDIDPSYNMNTTNNPNGFNITSSGYDLYENALATHEWFVLSSPNPTGGPYTPEYSYTGTDFSYNAEFGLYYFVIHRVDSECGTACYGKTICVDCQDVADDNCEFCNEIDCSLLDEWWPHIDADCSTTDCNCNITIRVIGEQFTNMTLGPAQGNTCYEIDEEGMYTFTLDAIGDGNIPSYVGSITGTADVTIIGCGLFIQTTLSNQSLNFSPTEECGEDCETPKGLTCQNGALTWDYTPGVTYILYISPNDPGCGCSGQPILLPPIETATNNYLIPFNLLNQCFSWRVVAVCPDGSQSDVSDPQCFSSLLSCDGGHGHDGDGDGKERGEFSNPTAQEIGLVQTHVYPNPSAGSFTIEFQAAETLMTNIEIYNIEGKLVGERSNIKVDNGQYREIWNKDRQLQGGLYFIQFTTPNGTYQQKVVILKE